MPAPDPSSRYIRQKLGYNIPHSLLGSCVMFIVIAVFDVSNPHYQFFYYMVPFLKKLFCNTYPHPSHPLSPLTRYISISLISLHLSSKSCGILTSRIPVGPFRNENILTPTPPFPSLYLSPPLSLSLFIP